MVIEDEAGPHTECVDCQTPLVTMVLMSAAGYYLGTECDHCGPYDRQSDYFASRDQAERVLDIWQHTTQRPHIREGGFRG